MSDKVKDDVHWVDKGEVEVQREGRRVCVKLPGPRYPSDRELLRQAKARVEQLERTVGELADEATGSNRRGTKPGRRRTPP